MVNVLVHLHPDFSCELEDVLKKWNAAQTSLIFDGIHPPKDLEALLLSGGAIPLAESLEIAKQIRASLGHTSDHEIMVFTEKRIFEDPYYQLYFGGLDGAVTISLDVTRRLFEHSTPTENYIFRTILCNIINYLAQRAGFETHSQTQGCLLDFCNIMPEIIRVIEAGPRFCQPHLEKITDKGNAYLLDLVDVVAKSEKIPEQDVEVSKRVTAFEDPIDIGIVVALEEEFREVYEHIRSRAKPIFNDEINQYYYLFHRGDHAKPYRCVTTFIGGMGPTKAALAGDRLIQQFKPATIVNIGIAGSMDKDVAVGDVVIADQVDEYLHSAQAIDGTGHIDFDFKLSGDPYKSTAEYVSHAKNLQYAHPAVTDNWNRNCAQRLAALVPQNIRSTLLEKRLVREKPRIFVGNLASGSIVGASEIFVGWLKDNRDRKYLALEMEAAGVMSAAHARATASLIIRGISDYGDSRKHELDKIEEGVLRRYAMNNVITLLWTLTDLQLIRRTAAI